MANSRAKAWNDIIKEDFASVLHYRLAKTVLAKSITVIQQNGKFVELGAYFFSTVKGYTIKI